ncbi:MAG: BMP family ABC transporter substrate-binding protein [Candidatus Izemoplasmatales bacterium]|jgi:basic membrane protein A|nr:BMP family ABC transporter substrate-binding protein [Candidatus Izemoplasmatales bacterium]MDD3864945.1 BMP family ABC transporter substrate-binding protein [Candidatus Izemoplasmatales bacterium]
MKKFLALIMFAALAFAFIGCDVTEETDWNIVMLTDVGTITDKSFNQGTWEGVKAFADANDIDAIYFRPNAGTQADYEEAIDLVVANGANVVVCPGFLFETAIYSKQTQYPNVHFILIDGQPHDASYNYSTAVNTLCILFQEEQSGFLAGYAAVADGYDNLGFMGGMELPAVIRFGIGYVAGAYYAAEVLDKTIVFNASRYTYLGDFNNDVSHTTEAASWYAGDDGVDIIFAAAGGAGNAVMAAAATANKKVIGVDVDQASQSTTVVSSAMKLLAVAVGQALTDLIIDDDFAGGTTLTKGAAQDAVGLPLGDSFKFTTFTEAQYATLLAQVKAGTIVVPTTEAELTTFIATYCGNPSIAALIAKAETEAAE